MNILDKIIASKIREAEERKKAFPVSLLAKSRYFSASTLSLKENLRSSLKTGIIAEFKRKSPSSGIINANADISGVCRDYESSGASAISILTDYEYFGGNLADLENARNIVKIPILRKDFIIDEYQVVEAKSAGADAILLIAAVLEKTRLYSLHRFARSLGLEVLVEVHAEECIEKIPPEVEIAGINCRDLKSFSLNAESFNEILEKLPLNSLKVAESGINSPEQLISLKHKGFEGFLIGSFFMKSEDPGKKCRDFITSVNKLTDR